MKELHDILIKENVIFFFKGTINQGSLLNLLSIVENQLNESTISIKIYNLMVEMLQNISKHSDSYSGEKVWKSGIFVITESEEEYNLISGNYILNPKRQLFENSIKYVNELSYNELILEYNRILHGSYIDNKRQGLGLLDIKRKSKTNLICNFYNIDKKLSFFTLQVIVKKQTI
ncbi:MAG: SiaB family protein kinase [Bacteroidota bacterium]